MENRQVKFRGEWEELIRQYQQSGQTIATFCEAHQIKVHQFHYWKKKVLEQKKEKGPGGFVSLQAKTSGGGIYLRWGKGVELELPGDYPLQAIGELIRQVLC